MPRRLALSTRSGPRAIRIGEVESGGPAALSGLRAFDIILDLDGEPVTGTDELVRMLGGDKVGRAPSLSVIRTPERIASA